MKTDTEINSEKKVNKLFKGKTETDTITMGTKKLSESQTISLNYTAVL